MLKSIVIDSKIPYIKGVLEPYFEVTYLDGDRITAAQLHRSSAVVVRTRTCCNEALLGGSRVEAVFTATSGTDHIDKAYCHSANITLGDAHGSNARAVAQWVWAALSHFVGAGTLPGGFTLGIVGVGAAGGEVLRVASQLGIRTILCDPPRQKTKDDSLEFVALEYLLQNCDAVTLHTPLDMTTRAMINPQNLSRLRSGGVVLNASRGEVLENSTIIADESHHFAIDVWEGEPQISLAALHRATIATPHIAGYSERGKALATTMVVRQVAQYFDIHELMGWDCTAGMGEERFEDFDIMSYDEALRRTPEEFEALRTVR